MTVEADVHERIQRPVDQVFSAIDENRRIVYESTATGPRSRVTITLTPVDAGTTRVASNEAGWPLDPEGVKRALGQTAGWTYFLCCLKAYLQHGINLRLGLVEKLTSSSAAHA